MADGKIQFLDAQNRKLKADLSEHQHNFDLMFQKFHQFRVADKEEVESTHHAFVSSIEEKFSQQLQELRDNHELQIQAMKEKLRLQEQEYRQLQTKHSALLEQKSGSSLAQEKRLGELLERERKLEQELLSSREQRDLLALQYHRELEKQKDLLRIRAQETESRLAKAETEASQLQFALEKLKA